MKYKTELIVALDVPGRGEADAMVATLDGMVTWYKVGLELFAQEGASIVRDYCAAGRQVFLDLKLHDIPETVARTTQRLACLGAGLLTVHSSGGKAMMEAAVRGAQKGTQEHSLRILAVTALTSMDKEDFHSVGIDLNVEDLVCKRAILAAEAGCHGIVASPHEAKMLREVLSPQFKDFLIVTPGIRPKGASPGDQKRVMTPLEASLAGADMIVVGRPIRDAKSPLQAAKSIIEELRV